MEKIDFSIVKLDDSSFVLPLHDWHNPNHILPCSGRELKFKLAAISLVLRGYYPSGRQILKELGSDRVNGKVNLNGRECLWKGEVFFLFKIKPYLGYSKRYYREDWESILKDFKFKYERGPKGTLKRITSTGENDEEN